ncbi:MAG: hypothetical protein ACREDM_02130 [Methylocella sp.]
MNAIGNSFVLVMHAFTINFGFSFDPNPKNGVGGSPVSEELWRIGIVQNVVYENLYFEYDGGRLFKTEFNNAAVDSVAAINFPFYHDPVIVPACKLDPRLGCKTFVSLMVPVADIWYTSQGYGELLNPYVPSGVAINNKPDALDMVDEPGWGAGLRLKRG